MRSGARFVWLPVVIFAGAVIVMSSVPGDALPALDVLGWDKLVHAVEFGTLAALLTWALLAGRMGSRTVVVVVIAVVSAIGFGVTDEWHQSFTPGRFPSAFDVLADAVGALTAAPLAALLYRRRHAT